MIKRLIISLFILSLSACSSTPEPSLGSADPDLRRLEIIRLSDSSQAHLHLDDFMTILQGDPDSLVRAQAAVALGKLKNPKALPVLLKAISDSNLTVRVDIVNALREINDRQAIPSLQKLLSEDASPEVRRASAMSLGKMGGDESIESLIQALDDVDPGVAEISYQELRQLTKQNLPKDIKVWENWHSTPK